MEAAQKEEEAKQLIQQQLDKKEEEVKGCTVTSETDKIATLEDTSLPGLANEGAADEVKIIKEGNEDCSTADLSNDYLNDAALNNLAIEYIEKFRAITPQSLGIELNPNCFLSLDASVDSDALAKDEEHAREVAKFLFNFILPTITKQVREGEFSPKDQDAMVAYLHRMGVNMRYLGRLAVLAHGQEKDDAELLLQGKQRVHSMPFYFQEFLVMEMLARACKRLLNEVLRGNKSVAAAPAETVAAMLNHVLALLHLSEEEAVQKEVAAAPTPAAAAQQSEAVVDGKKSTSKKKKKKAGKSGSDGASHVVVASGVVEGVANAFANKEQFLRSLAETLQAKFLYTFPLLTHALAGAKRAAADLVAMRSRLSPVSLVRRIAQQCGIVVAARNYEFQAKRVFSADDIIDIVPKVKTFEPDSYVPEYADLLNSSAAHLQQGNPIAAFEYAQQAVSIINQVGGSGGVRCCQSHHVGCVLLDHWSQSLACLPSR